MKHKKEKCKSKYENDKLRKKDKKKHKKRKKHDTSNSSDDDSVVEQEWVEKSVIQTDLTNQDVPTSTRKEESCKREDWMTVNSIFPCVFSDKKPSSISSDKHKCDLDKLGQSDKELNPYWKEGGNGLPSVDSISTNRDQTLDANWLKKSLRRAQEEAEREGKSLEEIAAQRWGSLEVIQSMISKAEKMCSRGNYKKQYDRRDNEKYKLENHVKKSERYKTSGECLNYSVNSKSDYHRSRTYRSRSRSSDRNERHSRRNNAQYGKHKQTYKRPVDCVDDDYSVSSSYNAHCSTTNKRWQKGTVLDKVKDTQSNASESKTVSVEFNSNVNNMSGNKETNAVPELDLNKLGAKIVKAEIMGDTKLVAELKIQLKEARELATNAIRLNESETDQTVILTRTDMKGVTRPLEHNQSTDSSRKTNRKTAQTHTAGKRTLHYFDDDKYSLQELFQREKGRSANEDDAAFTKVASRTMNMDEIFEEQITRVQKSSKRDEKDRSLAIKEHKRLSKSLDTCHWCIDSKYMLKHMIVAMDSDICLSLPAHTSLTEGHCMITPVQHIACQLQLDENIWGKLKAYKQALYNMFAEQNKYPVFYEIYKNRHKFIHMQLECVPLPKEIGELIPMYFKKALLECETEWSMNKKIIDLEHKDIKQAVPNGLSYFMVEFEIGKGYAHIIEDEHLFPKNFAEEIIGGMLDLDHDVWRKPRKETFDQQREKVFKFSETWKNYDCTIT